MTCNHLTPRTYFSDGKWYAACTHCGETKMLDTSPVTNPAATPLQPPTPGKLKVLDYVLADLDGNSLLMKQVRQDLIDRAEMGKAKYGTYLMSENGRNPLLDAYQECCDLVMYLKQAELEGNRSIKLTIELVVGMLLGLRSKVNNQ